MPQQEISQMPQRRVHLMGYTLHCEIDIIWNGQKVFAGNLSALGSIDESVPLAEWFCDIALTGRVPLKIINHSGGLTVQTILMNYIRPSYKPLSISDHAQWPRGLPTLAELLWDLGTLSESELVVRYGADKTTLRGWVQPEETIPIEDYMCEPFLITEDHDGKLDVKLDGIAQNRHDAHLYPGAWHWHIGSNQTFSCDILIDPSVIQTA